LPKSSTTLDDTSESSLLTPLGQKQHYDLGQWLRERYLFPFAEVLTEYNPNQVLVESTAYERTIVSANSLVLGLFPRAARGLQLFNETPDLIPVYTRARNNDLYLRAYDKCDALQDNLEVLYASDVWKTMEMENMSLLQRLAMNPAFSKYVVQPADGSTSEPYIPLTELWNVFDSINVVETECDSVVIDGNVTTSQVCQSLPDPNLLSSIDESDVNATKLLANTAELLRFSPTTADNKVGGAFLDLILQRMQSIANNTNAPGFLYVTSAHYPTLLGLLSALQTTFWDRYIPEYASALVLELYRREEDGEHFVKMYFKSGDSLDTLPLVASATCRTDLDEGCLLRSLIQESQSKRLTAVEWCQECNNTDVDVCLQNKLQEQQSSPLVSDEPSKKDGYLYFISFLGGVIFSAILFALWHCYHSRTGQEMPTTNEHNETGNMDSGMVSSSRTNGLHEAISI
jgi:Histidine phosphatase superfamily (branch 2)